jgi:osmotically-inducible protein OsmY
VERGHRNGIVISRVSAAMTKKKLYNEATEVSASDGEVILEGPDGVDVKVTPEAAEQTADNLVEGAVKARGQRRLRNLPHKPQ